MNAHMRDGHASRLLGRRTREIPQRYRAIDRWSDGRRVYDLARELFPAILPITGKVMDGARHLLDSHEHVMARDALHASVVVAYRLDGIVSYDRDFDGIAEVRRREP